MTCSKCLTEDSFLVKYTDLTTTYSLCGICNRAFDTNLLPEFMKEDFGNFPISEVSKNMINARKRRALGEGPWQKLNGDNKGQDYGVGKC
jgi:hypothetical protein